MVICGKAMLKGHVVDLGKLFLFKNLTRCRKVDLKSDKAKIYSFFKI